MLFRYDRDPANPLRVPPLRRSLDPRAIAIFIVDNAHGKFLYGINTAISDNRDEWYSCFRKSFAVSRASFRVVVVTFTIPSGSRGLP